MRLPLQGVGGVAGLALPPRGRTRGIAPLNLAVTQTACASPGNPRTPFTDALAQTHLLRHTAHGGHDDRQLFRRRPELGAAAGRARVRLLRGGSARADIPLRGLGAEAVRPRDVREPAGGRDRSRTHHRLPPVHGAGADRALLDAGHPHFARRPQPHDAVQGEVGIAEGRVRRGRRRLHIGRAPILSGPCRRRTFWRTGRPAFPSARTRPSTSNSAGGSPAASTGDSAPSSRSPRRCSRTCPRSCQPRTRRAR